MICLGYIHAQDHQVYVYNAEPSFPGGEEAMAKFIQDSLQYPVEARAQKISGVVRVKVKFDEEGNIVEVKAIYGPHESLKEEGARLVKAMPKWEPAIRSGEPVEYETIILIHFDLNE